MRSTLDSMINHISIIFVGVVYAFELWHIGEFAFENLAFHGF